MADVKTLFSETETYPTFEANGNDQALNLAPSDETMQHIRNIEESFALAEQRLGQLRVG